jgi:TolA-binding protein
MKMYIPAAYVAVLAAPAFCQSVLPDTPPVPPPPPAAEITRDDSRSALDARMADLDVQIAKMTSQIDSGRFQAMVDKASALADQFTTQADLNLDLDLRDLTVQMGSADLAGLTGAAASVAAGAKMAFLQNPNPNPNPKFGSVDVAPPAPPRPPKAPTTYSLRADSAYNAGTHALDAHLYDEAVRRFDSAILQEPTHADGALYWKAYALNRLGKRDDALAALAQLRKDFATSAWLKDAQVLEAEVKLGSGKPVAPEQETNDDLKLLAINSLMNADAERAIPLVEGILKGSGTPAVKDRALFVLAQNKSPRAQQAIFDYAKGGGNPDLQLRAIQYLGMSGSKEAQQQLVAVYGSTSDAHVKSAIIQALMMARASDALMNLAKSEKDASLRNAAIRNLIVNKGVAAEGFAEMYNGADASTKREIVNGLVARGDAKDLVNLARRESDSAMKKTIVERLSAMRDNKDALDYMMELLK